MLRKRAKSESLQTKLELKSTRPLTLPPLFAPFKDEKKGWTKSNVAEQVTLYINLLGYGYGGDKTFVASTKHKDSSKPEWFPDSISYESYTHPSKAKITKNEDVIESPYSSTMDLTSRLMLLKISFSQVDNLIFPN